MTLVQTELKKCYVGMGYTAMQGPCSEGYHIPTHTEWNSVKTMLGELGWNNTSGATLKEALYIPYSGHIARGNAVYDHSLNRGHLRCCDTSGVYAYEFDFSDGYININNDSNACRAYGYSIRPFKDVPVTPSSSWTIIDDGSDAVNPVNGAGIYHDATNGIISISSDAINWITIADKNLGATNVYSNGNTLSESNCGKYYQWGNNYGFPWNGSISSSSTLVNASMYGPENYYSSSTFILENSSVGDWSSVQNDNLWGGVSGLSPNKVKKIMLGSTQIRPAETEKQYNIDINNFESTTTFNYGDRGTTFSKGGYYFYSGGSTQINAYKLSTPYDVNNYIELKTETIPSTQEIHQVYISPDGTKLAWANYSSYIGIYDLTTPYDISTKSNLITSNPGSCTGIWFKPDGTELYVARYTNPGLIQYHLSTPWNVTTGTQYASFGSNYRCVSLSPDGQYLLYASSDGTAYQMKLMTPRDITTRQNYKTLASHYYPTLAVDGACFLDSRFMGKFYEL